MKVLLPDLLLDDSVFRQAAHRFELAFRNVWKKLPAEAKAAAQCSLRSRPAVVRLCFQMDFGNHPSEPWGRCSLYDDHMTFTFLSRVVQHVHPIIGLESVIAHELIHCLRHGDSSWTNEESVEERETRRIADEWGFPEPGTNDRRGWEEQIEQWRAKHRSAFGQFSENYFLLPNSGACS